MFRQFNNIFTVEDENGADGTADAMDWGVPNVFFHPSM
jgi:hypothetical protein